MQSKPYYKVSSLERGLKILQLLAETGGLSVSEVAARLSMHRSASHRFLATLRELGYVVQDQTSSRYRLTFKLFELGMRVVHTLEIRQVALPFMKELADITHETVNMGHWDGKEVIYIDKIASQEILRLDLAVGSRVPVYCSALGKAILAFRTDDEIQRVLKTLSMQPLTPKTISNKKDFAHELARIRETEYAVDDEEMGIGIRCIAAPVFDYSGYPEYALSVEGPVSRMTEEKIRSITEEVKRICRALSRSLGQNGRASSLAT